MEPLRNELYDAIPLRVMHSRMPSEEWAQSDLILFQGEIGIETDTGYLKVGDGINVFSKLKYLTGPEGDSGKPATVDSQEFDEEGNTIITWSDGTTSTIQRGKEGKVRFEDLSQEQKDSLTEEIKAVQSDLVNDIVDSVAVEKEAARRYEELEAEYAENLGELKKSDEDITAQLAHTVDEVNKAVSEATVDSEVILARGGEATLGVRLDKIEEIENSIVGKRIGGYTFNGNTEVHVTKLDEETGVFTATNHGLVNGTRCAVALNLDTPLINKTSLPDPLQGSWRYIVNATQDTFQVSKSSNGEPVLFTPNPSLDTNLWHLEATNSPVTSINLQGFSETELTIRFRAKSHVQADNIFELRLDDIEVANNFHSEVKGLITQNYYPAIYEYGHSNLAMFGEYKASLSEHVMIGKVNFYRADLATRTNPHSELSYKVFKDTVWATNTKKTDAFRGVRMRLGGHMLLNGSTLEVYNG